MNYLLNLGKMMANTIFPITCIGCGVKLPFDDIRRTCAKCWASIERIPALFCQICGTPLPDGGATCYICRKFPRAFKKVRGSAKYSGVMKEYIHRLKYKGQYWLAKPLAGLMLDAIKADADMSGAGILVPVPVTYLRARQRGYNQALLLAEEVSKLTGKPTLDFLIRTRNTKPQTNLTQEERLNNLVGTIKVKEAEKGTGEKGTVPVRGLSLFPLSPFPPPSAIIVDDVCTTGATINECAKALKTAGIRKIYGLVAAHG